MKNPEATILYMVVIYNRFGVMGIFTTTDHAELNARLKEETAKGRRCKVAEREVPNADAD